MTATTDHRIPGQRLPDDSLPQMFDATLHHCVLLRQKIDGLSAYPCATREAAYRLEGELLNQYRPRMNRTGRGAAV